jgi:site-specific DNA recombinase
MTSAYDDLVDELLGDDELLADGALPVVLSTVAEAVEPGSRAVIYLRVSSAGQVKNDYDPEGISIPAQRVKCQRKAEQLGLTIIGEYVEPGRTATEMSKRVEFQRMLTRVRNAGDVDYIIVYKLSRMARNRLDDAIVMADLRKRGVTLVSATESIDDSPVGQLMHGILATFNEYQSRESGADIAYKMKQKAKNGGTIGRAPLGYLNVRDRFDGREIRTIAVDPERAPFVQLAFELYVTGDYSLEDLSDELYDRGLRTRPTGRHPAKQVSINKLSMMLRDRYYLGYVEVDGEEVQGRHEPLIDDDLFDRVQDLLESRSTAGERRREHPHYLKGSLFCGRCKRAGITQRLIVQHTVNSRGSEYTYFFCRNKQNGSCEAPHINVALIEDAVENHYATIRFSAQFVATVRAEVARAIDEQEASERLLHKQLTTELKALDTREENLIELAADSTIGQEKIKTKLRDIARQRRRLTERLTTTTENLSDSARLIEAALTLLENPQELYRRCDEQQRRMLNQAIFHGLYVDDDQIADHSLREPFAQLHAVQSDWQTTDVTVPEPRTDTRPRNAKRAASQKGGGPVATNGLQVLLRGVVSAPCSSKTPRVELRGIEPLTFSMRTRRATNCATAPRSAAAAYQSG